MSLYSILAGRRSAVRSRKSASVRLEVETLNGRELPSAGGSAAELLGPALVNSHAHTVPHKEHCAGTLTRVEPGKLHFAGEGNATHFGKYSISGSNEFDDQGNVKNGEFTTVAADGATISGDYSGTYTVLADGRIRFDVHVHWTQGTGRLAGVTGEADTTAFLTGLQEGATFTYDTLGTLTFP
jgi:hypothetical protein